MTDPVATHDLPELVPVDLAVLLRNMEHMMVFQTIFSEKLPGYKTLVALALSYRMQDDTVALQLDKAATEMDNLFKIDKTRH